MNSPATITTRFTVPHVYLFSKWAIPQKSASKTFLCKFMCMIEKLKLSFYTQLCSHHNISELLCADNNLLRARAGHFSM